MFADTLAHANEVGVASSVVRFSSAALPARDAAASFGASATLLPMAASLSTSSTPNMAQISEPSKRNSNQSGESISIIYPDIGEPFRAIFATIIEGIEEKTKTKVQSYPLGPNLDPAELNIQLKKNGAKVVIALGRQGLKTAAGLDNTIAVVIGGVLSVPEPDSRNLTGISLTPDPGLLFMRLKNLLPGIKRVMVIYNPQTNEWLIKLAREAAKAQGLELVTFQARDLASAARLYESTFASADGRQDAVWLPQDSTTVDETTVLPLVLKESWNRGVPIFSSSLVHVKKGALFALYPNNLELGRGLAAVALNLLTGDTPKRGIGPLREVHTAVNLRTASHLGLSISEQQQRGFDFVYPVP
jgi:putative ABC transport system substrate-binding protein